ncbi:MAG: T9SS type A sorting domain-containing protein [Flavobacteriales bacterium]|nr:T9SS type A sorting domain-containing protein [Flavobacteriales bacterium]
MRTLFATLFLFGWTFAGAQTSLDYTVRVEAKAIPSQNAIELSWDSDANAVTYAVARKLVSDANWGTPMAVFLGESFLDTTIQEGVVYDYRVIKNSNTYSGYGYVRAAVHAHLEHDRGDALILVASNILSALPNEVATLAKDYAGDGFRAQVIPINPDTTVTYVKSLIIDAYDALPDLAMVFLLGHVPVPYSGNLAPDGHVPDHQGAWPADVYYADMDGTWTDNVVNNANANDPRNDNVTGDGKFDQSSIPGNARPELRLGRVDMANLTHFAADEVALTKAYLDRTHAYKQGAWTLPKRGLIDDNFGGFGGEAFGSNGWRNFSPLVGKDSIYSTDYRSTLASEGYLFSYGCGGGSHESASGIGTSTQLAGDSLLTGFTMLFGSYFGDWDRSDNFMRSALAQGRTMSISWAGRPWWYYHPMGLGASIGDCAMLTQGNNTTFYSSYGGRFVHVALLGDPSLRMEYVAPPTQLALDTIDTFDVALTWTASSDPNLDGYYVYRSMNGGPWERLTASSITSVNYTDACVLDSGECAYQVTAVSLVDGFSGSYFNESIAAEETISILSNKRPKVIAFTGEQAGFNSDTIDYEASTVWSDGIVWLFPDTSIVDVYAFSATINETGSTNPPYYDGVDFQIVTFNRCTSDSTWFYASAVIGGVSETEGPSIKVYPNPIRVGERLMVDIIGRVPYALVDLQGRRVASGVIEQGSLALDAIAPGQYFLTLGDRDGVVPIVVLP